MCRVALIGMMASGKTTIGSQVAESLGWPYIDNDTRLVERTGRGPREIEEEEGLDALHALEAALLLESLAEEGPAVVAAAASVIDDEDSRRALSERAYTVYVKAPPDRIAEKVADSDERPRTGENIAELAARRDPAYAAIADLTVDVAQLGKEQAATAIADAVRGRCTPA